MHVTIWFLRIRGALLRTVFRATWQSIAFVLISLYGAGALLMPLFEGSDGDFGAISQYTWWFFVTTTTVGYGDIAPETLGGRLTAIAIMVFGIGILAASVAKVAESVLSFGRNRMKGLSQLDEQDHLVIFGYHRSETEELVEQIRADRSRTHVPIVLCSSTEEENPLPDKVKFVKGDLASQDLLLRACVADASRILIHCGDDNETLVVVLAVRSVNSKAHVVAHLKKPDTAVHIHRIDPNIECVRPLTIPLTVQAIGDPGVTVVIGALLSNTVDDTIYRLDIPAGGSSWTFGKLQQFFKRHLGATLLAVGSDPASHSTIDLNPAYDSVVRAGETLYYIALERIGLEEIEWRKI